MLGTKLQSANAQIRYELRAQLTPANTDGWVNKLQTVSKVRAAKSIFVNNVKDTYPKLSLRQELKLEIGGVMGLGASSCKTMIEIDQNEFTAGSKAQIKITCDNEKCDKAVKSFKFKVHRRYQCIDFVKKEVTQHGGYVSAVKEEGLAAKSKCEKVFDVELPENNFSDFDPEKEFADRFGVSVSGKCIFIEYMLMVFVKHDSWD